MLRAIALSLLIGLFPLALPAPPASAASSVGPSIAVLGGKISATFSDDSGSRSQGWWSIAAERVGATSVTISAERSSSISSAGMGCRGTTYTERLRYLKRVDILIVEAGTEDHLSCSSSGKRKALSAVQRRKAIHRFTRALARRVDQLKIPRSRVYFVTPRTPAGGRTAAGLRKHIRHYATSKHARFRYIATPRLRTSQSIGRTLPNRAGNLTIGNRVAQAIAPVARRSRTKARRPAAGPAVMVFGDSMSSFSTGDPGSRSEAWWSMTARDLKASSVRVSAEAGSGMNAHGNGCAGTTFGDRLRHLRRVDVLIVEVGRNDYKACLNRTTTRVIDAKAQRAGIERYMRALGQHVAKVGMSPDDVYFVTPWGSQDAGRGVAMQALIKSTAEAPANGFTYIETAPMPNSHTRDRVHPNLLGNTMIARAVSAAVVSPPVLTEPAVPEPPATDLG